MAKIKSSARINNTGSIYIEPHPVDPTIYDDPVALRTDWKPLNYDSASFCTYRLTRVNSDRLAFKPTPQTLVLFGVFPFAGIALLLHTFSGHLEAFPLLLGLVLKNGKRIPVLSHSNKNKIRDDTLMLADFLDKPLWEAID